MRIVIDARLINSGKVGTTLLSILENLDYSANEYTLIGDKNKLSKYAKKTKILHNKVKPYSLGSFFDFNLCKVINQHDCFFTPNYIIPTGININCYCIIHDLVFYDKKKSNGHRFKDFIKYKLLKRSYKKAKKIFTVSEFTKKRIYKVLGKKKEVEVLKFDIPSSLESSKTFEKKDYIVSVLDSRHHKNLKTLLDAITKDGQTIPLHILISNKRLNRKERKIIDKLKDYPLIKVRENLTQAEYIKEMSEAKAYVNVSSYAGSSILLLDALKHNTPVIASNIPAYKEDFDNTEINYFSYLDTEELSDLIYKKKLKFKGVTNKEKFDSKIATKKIESSFEKSPKNKNVKRNFFFNVIYQILVVITPLITAPYVSRVLGASNLGQFSFAYTIAYYFIIAGYLGFQQYAQRAIAEVQDDKEEQSRVFWQIVLNRLFPVMISLGIMFILYFAGVFGQYSSLILIFSILVASTAFDINFYFHGKENFFIVMIINLIIRLVFLFLIFSLVKTRFDLGIYTLLYSLMVCGGYLTMWIMLPTNLRKVKLKTLDFKKHMKGSLSLFLPVAAISVYALLDKTLIGVLVRGQTYQRVDYITIIVNKSDLENGYYYQAERIVKAILSIILAFGSVMTTRNSIEYKNKHFGAIKKNVYSSFRFVFAVGVPLALGTVIVAQAFVPIFFGKFYEEVATLMMIYAPVILLIGISNTLGAQYLLPTKQDKKYSISVLIGFAFNLGLNALFIPLYGARGAIYGTLISEGIIVVIQYMFVFQDIKLKIILKIIYKYVIAGLIMFGLDFALYSFVLKDSKYIVNLTSLIITIPAGVLIYYFSLLIMRDKYVFRYSKSFVFFIGHFMKRIAKATFLTSSDVTTYLTTQQVSTDINTINNKENKNENRK